ncbi:MAG: 16S rRNA (guanine(966)-N(2))-methyltransferase RsmD [Firmicutes bacterium]|nr:16S rRNA (guanine(966)-N(2))-methyltransferase RsmD [Bacillota bacterium]
MRIISGKNRGRHLVAPKGMNTRPTADRVREAMFNVLAPYLEAAKVLDVFGGTGAFSLEALSRGAESAVILDKDRKAQAAIAQNIELCGEGGRAKLLKGDSLQLLPTLQRSFDLIFLDPPYAKDLLFPAISLILKYNLINDEGIVIIETAVGNDMSELPLEIRKESIYGDTKILYCLKRR